MTAKYFLHAAHMAAKRFRINNGRFSVFETGTQIIEKKDDKYAILYIGMHYLGDGLWEDSKLLIPCVLDSIRDFKGVHRYNQPLYKAIRLQVLRMSRMPYPRPGAPFADYEAYSKGSWFLGRVSARQDADNSALFDPSKWELFHGASNWYCRQPTRCRSSY